MVLTRHWEETLLQRDTTYFHPTDLSRKKDVVWGITLEPVARKMYSSQNNVPVREYGIFISPEESILCVSLDGVVGEDEDGILEIKCPRAPPNEVPNHYNFLIRDKDTEELILNKKHRY
ncbi:hypothetical protein FQR65_LT01352 [Abscondita terminalis]|nr:hypothetical protein FQR65_LT01352 [Abscondita terminalis]